MAGKPVIQADRVYRTIAALDDGTNPHDVDNLDEGALRKALRSGYLRPARFAPTKSPVNRPAIIAYAVTPEGRDFLHRVEAAEEVSS